VERELIYRILGRYHREVWIVVLASVLVNLLVFAGSVYMLLIYDSVLPSRSEPTLFGLFAMLALVYLVQAILEAIRSEALLSAANGMHQDLVEPVRHAAVSKTLVTQRETEGLQLSRDLDQVHLFMSGTGPVAIIDLPWVIIFLLVLFALHWALGVTALLGTAVLAMLAWWTSQRTAAGTNQLTDLAGRRGAATHTELRFAEAARAMGMQERLLARSKAWDEKFVDMQSYLSRTVARLGGAGRLFRLFLQSTMLTVGALLVIDGKASGGLILAASVLSGRALAPVDQAIANARSLSAARSGWTRIVEALARYRQLPARSVSLAPPSGEIAVHDIWVAPPGAQSAVLTGVSFSLQPGQVLAIVGPSAAGKSTLAKALLGVWPAARGEIRIDGASHDQWDRDVLGRSFGYVPQTIDLLEGTIGENIARFDPNATSEAVIKAAVAAGMHETILAFANGYDTQVSSGGGELSAGQRQRISLARALYGDPFFIVLDEPNSNLDIDGDAALAKAILEVRERRGVVVMVTHRPATLGPVTHVAVLASGKLIDFGERDPVLQRVMRGNATPSVPRSAGPQVENVGA
jgi:ATP-binding cassette subfamily C protein